MTLKSRNLIQAAEADLKRRERNKRRHQGDWLGPKGDTFEHYAFHAPHVRRAKSVNDLLRLALQHGGPALSSKKKNTRLIYGDEDLLAAAFTISGT
jgi:hypothetical protein